MEVDRHLRLGLRRTVDLDHNNLAVALLPKEDSLLEDLPRLDHLRRVTTDLVHSNNQAVASCHSVIVLLVPPLDNLRVTGHLVSRQVPATAALVKPARLHLLSRLDSPHQEAKTLEIHHMGKTILYPDPVLLAPAVYSNKHDPPRQCNRHQIFKFRTGLSHPCAETTGRRALAK